jgi:uncharacterized protein YndB with AHSA1/START domain
MTTQSAETTVTATTVVEVPVERAFQFFTEEMDAWWDPDHHLIEAPLERMVVEPRPGGRIYDLGTDGSECQWARVLAVEPPHRFVFSWDIDLEWKVETDPAKASEVEVRFESEGEGRTRATLEHRHLDRHGDGWERMRDGVGSPNGWPSGIDRFAAALV